MARVRVGLVLGAAVGVSAFAGPGSSRLAHLRRHSTSSNTPVLMSAYDAVAKDLDTNSPMELSTFKGKVGLFVNVASR